MAVPREATRSAGSRPRAPPPVQPAPAQFKIRFKTSFFGRYKECVFKAPTPVTSDRQNGVTSGQTSGVHARARPTSSVPAAAPSNNLALSASAAHGENSHRVRRGQPLRLPPEGGPTETAVTNDAISDVRGTRAAQTHGGRTVAAADSSVSRGPGGATPRPISTASRGVPPIPESETEGPISGAGIIRESHTTVSDSDVNCTSLGSASTESSNTGSVTSDVTSKSRPVETSNVGNDVIEDSQKAELQDQGAQVSADAVTSSVVKGQNVDGTQKESSHLLRSSLKRVSRGAKSLHSAVADDESLDVNVQSQECEAEGESQNEVPLNVTPEVTSGEDRKESPPRMRRRFSSTRGGSFSGRRLSQRRRRSRKGSSSSQRGTIFSEDEEEILGMYEQAEQEDEEETEEDILENIREQKEIINNIKFQPWRMSQKLKIVKLAKAYVEKYEGRLSAKSGYKHQSAQFFQMLKKRYRNFVRSMTPWESRINKIESHFGSVVASYFTFFRWLMWINIWLTVLPLCFIIIPEMIVGDPYGSVDRKTIPEGDRGIAYDLKTIWDAEGVVKSSPMFYGYYGNAASIGSGYNLPLVYLIINLILIVYSFVVILRKMASNSRQSRLSSKDEEYTFCWKLWTEWDFMIGNPETANNKRAAIITTFKEAIIEEQEKKKEVNKRALLALRILANVIVLASLALSAYIVQLCVDRSRETELKQRRDKSFQPNFWEQNELTVIMTLIATLFPSVTDTVAAMEKYHPRTTLRLSLARIFVLNLLNLYTLFIALYNKQNDLKIDFEQSVTTMVACNVSTTEDPGFLASTTTPTSDPGDVTPFVNVTQDNVTDLVMTTLMLAIENMTSSAQEITSSVQDMTSSVQDMTSPTAVNVINETSCMVALNVTPNSQSYCWETMIGQEVFKLTVMDHVFTVGQILLQEYFRALFIRYCNSLCCWDMEKNFPEYPDFKTAENLLHLINNQGAIWLGTFFSPGLPVLNFFKLLMLLYLRSWIVLSCNVPQERIFRASRSNNFYYALLLIMLFLSMLPPLFAIVVIEPSPGCGPFSGKPLIYNYLTDFIKDSLPEAATNVLSYVASPGVVLPVFMLLCMSIYYLVSVGKSLKDANNELKNQLEYERTEGRRKVYAMADAKRTLNGGEEVKASKGGGGRKPGMSTAANSVMAAARIAQALKGFQAAGGKLGKGDQEGKGGKKAPPAPAPKPRVPVAVVHGNQTLRGNGHRKDRKEARDPERAVNMFKSRVIANTRDKRQRRTIQDDDYYDDNDENVTDSRTNRRKPRDADHTTALKNRKNRQMTERDEASHGRSRAEPKRGGNSRGNVASRWRSAAGSDPRRDPEIVYSEEEAVGSGSESDVIEEVAHSRRARHGKDSVTVLNEVASSKQRSKRKDQHAKVTPSSKVKGRSRAMRSDSQTSIPEIRVDDYSDDTPWSRQEVEVHIEDVNAHLNDSDEDGVTSSRSNATKVQGRGNHVTYDDDDDAGSGGRNFRARKDSLQVPEESDFDDDDDDDDDDDEVDSGDDEVAVKEADKSGPSRPLSDRWRSAGKTDVKPPETSGKKSLVDILSQQRKQTGGTSGNEGRHKSDAHPVSRQNGGPPVPAKSDPSSRKDRSSRSDVTQADVITNQPSTRPSHKSGGWGRAGIGGGGEGRGRRGGQRPDPVGGDARQDEPHHGAATPGTQTGTSPGSSVGSQGGLGSVTSAQSGPGDAPVVVPDPTPPGDQSGGQSQGGRVRARPLVEGGTTEVPGPSSARRWLSSRGGILDVAPMPF